MRDPPQDHSLSAHAQQSSDTPVPGDTRVEGPPPQDSLSIHPRDDDPLMTEGRASGSSGPPADPKRRVVVPPPHNPPKESGTGSNTDAFAGQLSGNQGTQGFALPPESEDVELSGEESDASSEGGGGAFVYSLSKAYDAIFRSVPEDVCQPPPAPPSRKADSATEAILCKLHGDSVTGKTPPLVLPIADSVLECIEPLEELNTSNQSATWSVPAKTVKSMTQPSAHRFPAPDSKSGLDLSNIPSLEICDGNRANLIRPNGSSSVSVPLSMLETWEARERMVSSLVSQMDFLACAITKLSGDCAPDFPEDLRQLTYFFGKSCKSVAAHSLSSMAEMLRLRRNHTLQASKSNILLDSSKVKLLTAPLCSQKLFGGLIPEVLTTDRDDQLHYKVAGDQGGQGQSRGQKRPAPSEVHGSQRPKKKKASGKGKEGNPPSRPPKNQSGQGRSKVRGPRVPSGSQPPRSSSTPSATVQKP